jgi:hypothetical protein
MLALHPGNPVDPVVVLIADLDEYLVPQRSRTVQQVREIKMSKFIVH